MSPATDAIYMPIDCFKSKNLGQEITGVNKNGPKNPNLKVMICDNRNLINADINLILFFIFPLHHILYDNVHK